MTTEYQPTLNDRFREFCEDNGLTDGILLARRGDSAIRISTTADDIILYGTLKYHELAVRLWISRHLRETAVDCDL